MSVLAPEELASLRGVATASLSGRCDVQRKVRVRQPNGSWKDTQTTVRTQIPCRKVPSGQTPQELAFMQREVTRGFSTFLLDAVETVYADDAIVYLDKTYEVVGIHERTDEIYTRVIVYDDSKPAPVPAP